MAINIHSIIQVKEAFLNNPGIDLSKYPDIRPEVAESWLDSYKAGVDPDIDPINHRLPRDKVKNVFEANKALIEATKPLLDTMEEISKTNDCSMCLIAKDGTVLLQIGRMLSSKSTTIPGETYYRVLNENTIGTCSHVLCKKLGRPIQLVGPEHYCRAHEKLVGSSAPIFDGKGDVIACLLFSQLLRDYDEQKNKHTLGLVAVIALAIQGQLELKRSYHETKITNELLNTTLDLINTSIITVTATGEILHVNEEGRQMLSLVNSQDITKHNIKEFLDEKTAIFDLAQQGKSVSIEEVLRINQKEQIYLIDIRSIIDGDTNKIESIMLRFTPLKKRNDMIAKAGSNALFQFSDIIGKSNKIQNAIALGRKFARSSDNVLLIGESGTGKEMFAQSIHNMYNPEGPFISINCAVLPRELIASELFGFEGGSFTGADRSGRPGKIELAHNGTLFMDEIGIMPFELQAALLRVLEDKQVMRIGGKRYQKVNFRLIAATNEDLENAIKEHRFREDLFFRLSVLTINIPPLRERKEDILDLCNHFINDYAIKNGLNVSGISIEALDRILNFEWPGNVRQLQNAIIYAMNVAEGPLIQIKDLPKNIVNNTTDKPNSITGKKEDRQILKKYEIYAIKEAMKKTNNNVLLASEMLGMHKSTLYRRLNQLKKEGLF